MNTAIKNKYYRLLLCGLILSTSFCFAQPGKQADERYIYRIVVFCKDGHNMTLTGFKPKGFSGIISAMHGFTSGAIVDVLAQTFNADGSVRQEFKYPDLVIRNVDINKDLVWLECTKLPREAGIPLAKNYVFSDYEELIVYGYPTTYQLQSDKKNLQRPSPTKLGIMIRGTLMESGLKKRGSPQFDTPVIRLPGDAIFPGHSGGPVVNRAGEVVGIANGGFIVGDDAKIATMAIVSDNKLPDQSYRDAKITKLIQEVEKNPATLYSATTERSTATEVIDLFQFKKATPFLTVGGTLSRPFRFTDGGQETDINAGNRNERFDGYAEIATGSYWAIGAYLSSGYLQYTILKSFDLAIPLQAEQRVRQARSPDSYGVQASYIFSRGVIHNAYLGAGYFPVVGGDTNARLRFNYRGFIGYRLYAGPRRKVGLELRAMYVGQNIEAITWQPTLGNASPVRDIHSLTQWYICGGLTYSIYRRK